MNTYTCDRRSGYTGDVVGHQNYCLRVEILWCRGVPVSFPVKYSEEFKTKRNHITDPYRTEEEGRGLSFGETTWSY